MIQILYCYIHNATAIRNTEVAYRAVVQVDAPYISRSHNCSIRDAVVYFDYADEEKHQLRIPSSYTNKSSKKALKFMQNKKK